jgi:hypothetical protein
LGSSRTGLFEQSIRETFQFVHRLHQLALLREVHLLSLHAEVRRDRPFRLLLLELLLQLKILELRSQSFNLLLNELVLDTCQLGHLLLLLEPSQFTMELLLPILLLLDNIHLLQQLLRLLQDLLLELKQLGLAFL